MSNFGKILVVEDDNNLGDTLSEYLEDVGHQCKLAKNVKDARYYFEQFGPNIILMDIGLPDGNGIELAKEFRKERRDFILLFLSALNDPQTKVEGFEAGGEDYITKPFALKELTIRLDRLLSFKTTIDSLDDEIIIGDLKIWPKRFEVQDGEGKIINLTQKECAILEILLKKKNEAVERDLIIEKVWGEDKFPSQRTVDNYIVKLRKWAESDSKNSLEIQSVRGIGYKLIINK
ncbi:MULTISPECIES: response regulator transcription factor [Halobacteriovorax]|nr:MULTISPECIES: response regulator transcription factor [Halobacteriovorax]AYF45014.1 putative alkaline phosphatase synthesis transcriptional regulatory protein PhoP [Halobacteriovorax sp. BALOs_7]